MNIEELRTYCLAKQGATEDQALGPDHLLFRLAGRIFACLDLNRPHLVTLKCSPEKGTELRERFEGINSALHWNKQHWLDVYLTSDVSDEMLLELINESYELILHSLPKKMLYRIPELPQGWKHQHFPSCSSTMDIAREVRENADHPEPWLITTDYQTNGRGQGKHSWESEAAQNLLLSLKIYPRFLHPRDNFLLSQAAALSVCRSVRSYVGKGVSVKWPNDIYIDNHKVAGILIEHELSGQQIQSTIIGIGINVEQQNFLSDAPNPISISSAIRRPVDRAALLRRFLTHFMHIYQQLELGNKETLMQEYLDNLYRREDFFAYEDSRGAFEAKIVGIFPDGSICLQKRNGERTTYTHGTLKFIL